MKKKSLKFRSTERQCVRKRKAVKNLPMAVLIGMFALGLPVQAEDEAPSWFDYIKATITDKSTDKSDKVGTLDWLSKFDIIKGKESGYSFLEPEEVNKESNGLYYRSFTSQSYDETEKDFRKKNIIVGYFDFNQYGVPGGDSQSVGMYWFTERNNTTDSNNPYPKPGSRPDGSDEDPDWVFYRSFGSATEDDIPFKYSYNASTQLGRYGNEQGEVTQIEDLEGLFFELDNKQNGQWTGKGGGALKDVNAGTIKADFVRNRVEATNADNTHTDIRGGAIYMDGSSRSNSNAQYKIGNIIGNFILNYAKSEKKFEGQDNRYDFSVSDELPTVQDAIVKGMAADGGAIHLAVGAIGYDLDPSEPGGIGKEKIGGITGDFIGNLTTSLNGRAWGGAIYNSSINSVDSGGMTASRIGDITGHFIGNYAIGNFRSARGGAIYSHHEQASIGVIVGDFIANYARTDGMYLRWDQRETGDEDLNNFNPVTDVGFASGGAIYNGDRSEIEGIIGDFIGNHVENTHVNDGSLVMEYEGRDGKMNGRFDGDPDGQVAASGASGGAICNTAEENTTVIGDDHAGTIGYIVGDFRANYAKAVDGLARGGAIANSTRIDQGDGGKIGDIVGNFESNYAQSKTSHAYGGAIYNSVDAQSPGAVMDNITGSFTDNYAISTEGNSDFSNKQENDNDRIAASGGAIYNSSASITNIKADFVSNYTVNRGGRATGGAIHNSHTKIGSITGDFTTNFATAEHGDARGGALYNRDAEINGIEGSFKNNTAKSTTHDAKGGAIYNDTQAELNNISGDFESNSAISTSADDGVAQGGAIYNSEGSDIKSITAASDAGFTSNSSSTDGGAIYNVGDDTTIGNIISNFAGNKAGQDGGAIYNSDAADIKKITAFDTTGFAKNEAGQNGGAIYNVNATIDDISSNFAENKAGQDGGAIYNVNAATLGTLKGDFTENVAQRSGGAIYNADKVTIKSIEESSFVDNRAVTGSGGAIYNSDSSPLISVQGHFTTNTAAVNGGAIYNEEAYIGYLSGNFTGNTAEKGQGGAIYNAKAGEMTLINGEFTENETLSGGMAIHNIGQIGGVGNVATKSQDGKVESYEDDATPATERTRQYDATIVDGIVNAQFRDNTAKDGGLENAAIYTETGLGITAKDGYKMVFDNNKVGDKGVTRDLYVANGSDIYMIAEDTSHITTNGEILGEKGFVLRLRGHGSHAEELNHARSGSITFNGLVINADVIMDDVTLRLGTKKATDHKRYSEEDKPYIPVYDDTISHLRDGMVLIPTEDPSGDGVKIDGSKGDAILLPPTNDTREYSDVLRMSRLAARSGNVNTADDAIVNYNIGTIVSNGRKSYEDEQGYYGEAQKEVYATWSIDINMDELKADTFTTWYKEDDEKAQSKGYLTLSGCSIVTNSTPQIDFHGHDHSGDDYDFIPGDKYPAIGEYFDANIQIINLVQYDKDGKDIAATLYKEDSPLQLDLGELRQVKDEAPYMTSNDWLCEGISYGTTKTLNDSIRIRGWRDNLAAWSELQKDGDASADVKEYGKEFEILGTHMLTRNIKRGDNGRLLQQDGLMIYGKNREQITLNVNGYNLLAEVAKGQTLELRNLTISNVGTKDTRRAGESIYNKTQVDGTLILDSLKFADSAEKLNTEYTVVNDSEVIRRGAGDEGQWDIYYVITSHMSGQPGKAENGVTNVLRLQDGKAEIIGTVEHQNIINETEAAHTILQVNTGLDNVNNAGKSYELWTKDETGQFQRFVDNSLTMQAGRFDLNNLNRSELILRDFNVNGGILNVNSVTVDLSAKADIVKVPGTKVDGWNEGHMGMIWATETASRDANGDGKIWVHRVQLLPKDGVADRIPVQFVNPEVGESVVPFNELNDDGTPNERDNPNHHVSKTYDNQFGQVYVYTVHFDYTMGQYIYERVMEEDSTEEPPSTTTPEEKPGKPSKPGKPVVNPNVQASPAATLAGGIASLMQVNDYVFEHADLFSAHVYNTQKARLRERSFTIVTPTKGKNAVAKAPAPKASCSYLAGFKGGMWVRPYAGYEKLPLSGGPKVTNSLYGALVGGDTELKEHKNGWSSVFSAHAAYMGSTQRYTERGAGVRISQNGGGVGLTGTFYYKNFYTALTGTVATSGGHASGSQGTENFRTVMGGVASRSGYNIEFGKGRYVLQPTLLASFTSIHMPDYTNAAGAHITANPLNVLQLHPYAKFIMNTDSCWEPYFTLGYVHNLTGKTSYRANGIKLPEMSIDPYVEYSLGVQKTWADKYTIFGQATGRNGGRNGVEFSAGFRCAW